MRIKFFKNLYCIIGPSGSGKTAIADIMENRYNRKVLRSYTTRPKRHPDDNDHIFISEQEYDELKDKVATTAIDGYRYCATAKQIDDSEFYVVDWAGFDEMLEKYRGKKKGIYAFYLNCPKDIRESRMVWRGDGESNIENRLKIDEKLFSKELYEAHKDLILKTINTSNISQGSVAGIVRILAERRERLTK